MRKNDCENTENIELRLEYNPKWSGLISEGKLAEREGRTDDAIRAYEEDIALEDFAPYPYRKLAIIYHKRQDYENEIRVLREALKNDVIKYDWFEKRLERIERMVKGDKNE